MLTGRRKKYFEKISGYLTAHPELVNVFLIVLCDELSVSDIGSIYRNTKLLGDNGNNERIIRSIKN